MGTVIVRYAAPGGGITHKRAEVLNRYPALESLRVRILDTGAVRHINVRSVVARAARAQGEQP